MNRIIKTLVVTLIASTIAMMSIGCNTMEGVGKDTKSAGQGIQNAADSNK